MFSGLTRYEQWLILGLIAILGLGLAARQARLGRNALTLDLGHESASVAPAQSPPSSSSSLSTSSSSATSYLAAAPYSSETVSSGSNALQITIAKAASAPGASPAQSSPLPESAWTAPDRLDINTATAADLERLPEIGPSKAAAIVADRIANGPFRSVDDLDRVKGIGKSILEQIRPMITTGAVAAENAPDPLRPRPAPSPASSSLPAAPSPAADANASAVPALSSAPAGSGPVNINAAEWEELTRLHGIGELLAKRIVQYRTAHGRFRRAEDLQNVRGIGPKLVEKNRAMIRVD